MSVGGGFVQTVGNPGVQAFPGLAGGDIGPSMEIGRKAKHEAAGEWLFRFVPKLLAKCEIVFHRIGLASLNRPWQNQKLVLPVSGPA